MKSTCSVVSPQRVADRALHEPDEVLAPAEDAVEEG